MHWLAAEAMHMSKRRAVTMGLILGLVSSMSACVAEVDDPVEEDVDVAEAAFEPILPRLRIRRPNPIDPGWRLLRCLPDPRKEYIARDPDVCAGIRFFCTEGIPFFDGCGCGCKVRFSRE
jgi:hypothetical protein